MISFLLWTIYLIGVVGFWIVFYIGYSKSPQSFLSWVNKKTIPFLGLVWPILSVAGLIGMLWFKIKGLPK